MPPDVLQADATIAALATAIGGPVAIVRLSGPDALGIASAVWSGADPLDRAPVRTMRLGRILHGDGRAADQALAVYMPGPASYTGEDSVEIHCHGGGLVARTVLVRVLESGARHADPGEFTRRAFINGKLDLTQAEAVCDVINAHSEMALNVASRQLQGALGRRTETVYAELARLLGEVESRLDFPDEELDWIPPDALAGQFDQALEACRALLTSRNDGEVLRHGVRLVLAGPPNVGKSSLLNAVLGRDRAIVTHIPGTTRDTLEELAHVRGIPLQLVDTAGIREALDPVEQSGISRTLSSMKSAQLIVWVFDASQPFAHQHPPADCAQSSLILVGNKADLVDALPADSPEGCIATSALNGAGLDDLFDAVERTVWDTPHAKEPDVAISARHAALLADAVAQLEDAARECAGQQWELAAVALRAALDAVGQITGRTATVDILDTIFAKFCIGK